MLDAKVISKCTIIPQKTSSDEQDHLRSYVLASAGIFDSKISSALAGIEIISPAVEGCDIEFKGGGINFRDLKKLAKTHLSAIRISLDIMSDF